MLTTVSVTVLSVDDLLIKLLIVYESVLVHAGWACLIFLGLMWHYVAHGASCFVDAVGLQ